jgi:hypothetical protein
VKIATFLATHLRITAGLLASGLALLSACSYDYVKPVTCATPVVVSYQTDVLPILKQNCYRCHDAAHFAGPSSRGSLGNLNMESFPDLQFNSLPANGRNGVANIVGNVRHDAGFVAMPFDGGKLSDCDIAIIEAWSKAGAPNN